MTEAQLQVIHRNIPRWASNLTPRAFDVVLSITADGRLAEDGVRALSEAVTGEDMFDRLGIEVMPTGSTSDTDTDTYEVPMPPPPRGHTHLVVWKGTAYGVRAFRAGLRLLLQLHYGEAQFDARDITSSRL